MASDTRGTDVVIIGILIFLLYKAVKEPAIGAQCLPSDGGYNPEPQSSLIGPAWTQNPVQQA